MYVCECLKIYTAHFKKFLKALAVLQLSAESVIFVFATVKNYKTEPGCNQFTAPSQRLSINGNLNFHHKTSVIQIQFLNYVKCTCLDQLDSQLCNASDRYLDCYIKCLDICIHNLLVYN